MKAAFTDIDREAVRLFEPAEGMRMCRTVAGRHVWLRISGDPSGVFNAVSGDWVDDSISIDTDDPATVGCMLAQYREAAGQPGARPVVIDEPSENVWRLHWTMTVAPHQSVMAATEGGAIVAAMRMLKKAT